MAERWRVRRGDRVIVLSGKDKGKTGEIIQVLREKRRVVVSGVNMVTRHVKPNIQYPNGGLVRGEASLHASNVAHVDPESGKPTRVGVKMDGERKVRYAKRSGNVIES